MNAVTDLILVVAYMLNVLTRLVAISVYAGVVMLEGIAVSSKSSA